MRKFLRGHAGGGILGGGVPRGKTPSALLSAILAVLAAAAAVSLLLLALLPELGPPLAFGADAPRPEAKSGSCVTCHSDAVFLVQNRKLYDYFQGWEGSVHAQENVGCVDCHGGDATNRDKDKSHAGKAMGAGLRSSAISYQNIPSTCARCHEAIYERYQKSEHFKHLETEKASDQGPTCVTCHGSVNTTILTVRTVRDTCAQCHNKKTDNAPEIPSEAEAVLNNFLSINRYYRFISLRGEPEDVRTFFKLVDPAMKRLNAEWHTFDLEGISQQTEELIHVLRSKRQEIRSNLKERRNESTTGGSKK